MKREPFLLFVLVGFVAYYFYHLRQQAKASQASTEAAIELNRSS